MVPKMTVHEFFRNFWKGDKLDVGISIMTVVFVIGAPLSLIAWILIIVHVLSK